MSKRPQSSGPDFSFLNALEARQLLSGMGFDFHDSIKPAPIEFNPPGEYSFRSLSKGEDFFGQPQPFGHDSRGWNADPKPFRISLNDRSPYPQGDTFLIIKMAKADSGASVNNSSISIEPTGQSTPVVISTTPAYTPPPVSYIPPVTRPAIYTPLVRASAAANFNADRALQSAIPVVNAAARLGASPNNSIVTNEPPVVLPAPAHAIHETPVAFVPPTNGETTPETKSVAFSGTETQAASAHTYATNATQGQSSLAFSPWESLAWWLGRRSRSVGTHDLNVPPGESQNVTEAGSQAMPQHVDRPPVSLPGPYETLFESLSGSFIPPTDAQLLSEISVEDQSDIIQSSIDAILADLTPAEDLGLTARSGFGSSVGLAVATAIAVEYIRHKREGEAEIADPTNPGRTELASHSFRPACEESETAV